MGLGPGVGQGPGSQGGTGAKLVSVTLVPVARVNHWLNHQPWPLLNVTMAPSCAQAAGWPARPSCRTTSLVAVETSALAHCSPSANAVMLPRPWPCVDAVVRHGLQAGGGNDDFERSCLLALCRRRQHKCQQGQYAGEAADRDAHSEPPGVVVPGRESASAEEAATRPGRATVYESQPGITLPDQMFGRTSPPTPSPISERGLAVVNWTLPGLRSARLVMRS